jgi:hypothetical protein
MRVRVFDDLLYSEKFARNGYTFGRRLRFLFPPTGELLNFYYASGASQQEEERTREERGKNRKKRDNVMKGKQHREDRVSSTRLLRAHLARSATWNLMHHTDPRA